MIDIRKLEEIATQIQGLLPNGAVELRDELKSNIRAVLESAFSRLELVTRDEFDAQTALLIRARERLDELQQIVSAMEQAKTSTPQA